MAVTTQLRHYRYAVPLVIVAMLWGCGQGDDKGKAPEKKVEPPAPPKATPAPPKATPAPPKETPKASTRPDMQGWTLLGQEQASFKNERDRISVDPEKKGVKELRIVVEGAPVEIEEMMVTFRNDKQFKADLKQSFDAGAASRVIDLPGEKHAIKHVDFRYRTATKGGGKATVMLYGR